MADVGGMTLKRELIESKEIRTEKEVYRAEYAGFDIQVRRDRQRCRIWVCPVDYAQRQVRLGLVDFYPKKVAELDELAEVLPGLLRMLAAALRVEGLDDLRGEHERMLDLQAGRLATK